MLGGAALLADGMITPPISITSAIEGLRQIPRFHDIAQQTIVLIVLGIITIIFFLQQFGTASIGRLFGPIMLIWFLMLAVMGSLHLFDDLHIFKALNPYYAIDLLTNYPKGFWILGAVFRIRPHRQWGRARNVSPTFVGRRLLTQTVDRDLGTG